MNFKGLFKEALVAEFKDVCYLRLYVNDKNIRKLSELNDKYFYILFTALEASHR